MWPFERCSGLSLESTVESLESRVLSPESRVRGRGSSGAAHDLIMMRRAGFPKARCLEPSASTHPRHLRGHERLSTGRAIRPSGPDPAQRDVDSVEHRRGSRSRDAEGLRAVPLGGNRVGTRARLPASTLQRPRLHLRREAHGTCSGSHRGSEHAGDAPETCSRRIGLSQRSGLWTLDSGLNSRKPPLGGS